jgi:histidinol phosphatase-like enzyme (inositol monophosphatase family)
MSPRLEFAIDAATKAGRLTLAHFQTGVPFDTKSDASPVTIADRMAERKLREAIEREFPGDHILGEEEGGDATVPDRWVLDPIDGTKSFVSGVPLYATLVSYERDFVPQLGVVYLPALDELVCAERGSGTFWNGRPARVSSNSDLGRGVVCCGGHRTMIDQGRMPGFQRIVAKCMATRTWGDAYGHVLVATGRVEAMIDPLVSRWDLSAVQVVVEEAGGRFTDLSGGPSLTGELGLEAISSNGLVHRQLIEAFSA